MARHARPEKQIKVVYTIEKITTIQDELTQQEVENKEVHTHVETTLPEPKVIKYLKDLKATKSRMEERMERGSILKLKVNIISQPLFENSCN